MIAFLFMSAAQALSVIQWQDNMVLSKNTYLDLTNNNKANSLSQHQPNLAQSFIFNLVICPCHLLDFKLPKLRIRCTSVRPK